MWSLPELRLVPDLLIIEATTYCTNTCQNCPRGQNRIAGAHLSPARFQDLLRELDSIAAKPRLVRFAGFGEPLCWPWLRGAIVGLSDLGIRSAIVTNGQFFREWSAADLFDAGLDEMEISAGDFESRRYEEATGGVATSRATAMAEAARVKPDGKTLNVSVIDSPQAERSIELYKSFTGIDRVFKRQALRLGSEAFETECEGKRWPCPQLWQRLSLTVEGKWRYCCSDWRNKTVLPQTDLIDVWQGPDMAHHRLHHAAGDFEAVPACGDCSIWCTSKWGKDSYYEEALEDKQG